MTARAKSELRRPPIAGQRGIISNPYLKQKAPILTIPSKNENSFQSSRSQTMKKKQKASLLNDSNCISARDSLFNGGDIFEIEDETLQQMPLYLSQYSQSCAREYNLDDAQKARKMIPKVMNEINERKANHRKQGTRNSNETNKNQIDYAQCLSTFDSDTEKGRDALKQKQKEELEKFENYWENEMPAKYQKSSTHTLQLKFVRKQLILSKQYEQAKQKAKEIELSEKKDMEIAQKQLDSDYLRYRGQLLSKHKRDLEVYDEGRKSQRIVMEIAQKKEEEVQNKTNGNAQLREKTWKVTKTSQANRRNPQYSGIYDSLSPSDDKVSIDTSIPSLMGPAQSTSRKRREVIHKRMKAPKKESNDAENQNTQQTMDKNIWGYHVDVNNEMFSLKNQDRNERYLALPKYNQKNMKESKYSKRLNKRSKQNQSNDEDDRKSSNRRRNEDSERNTRESPNISNENRKNSKDGNQKGDFYEGKWQSIAMDSQSDGCPSCASNMAQRGNSSTVELESESVSESRQHYIPQPMIIDINTLQIDSESTSTIATLPEKSIHSERKEEEIILTPKDLNNESPKEHLSSIEHEEEKSHQNSQNNAEQMKENQQNSVISRNNSKHSSSEDDKQNTISHEEENHISLKAVALNVITKEQNENQENKEDNIKQSNDDFKDEELDQKLSNTEKSNQSSDKFDQNNEKSNYSSQDNLFKSSDSKELILEKEQNSKSNTNSKENFLNNKEGNSSHDSIFSKDSNDNENEVFNVQNDKSNSHFSNIIKDVLNTSPSNNDLQENKESNEDKDQKSNETKEEESFDSISENENTGEVNNNTFENSHIDSEHNSSFISESEIKPINSRDNKSDDDFLDDEDKNSINNENNEKDEQQNNSSMHQNLLGSLIDDVVNSKENMVDVASQHDSFIEDND